jgi:hypothetical protein
MACPSATRGYYIWGLEVEIRFLNMLVDALKEPNSRAHDGKIKSETWNAVIIKFNAETRGNIERKNVESHTKIWKTMLKNYQKIVSQSGWGRTS